MSQNNPKSEKINHYPTVNVSRSPKSLHKKAIGIGALLAAAVVAGSGVAMTEHLDGRGSKLRHERAAEIGLIKRQLGHPDICLYGYVELMPNDTYRNFPSSINSTTGHGIFSVLSIGEKLPVLKSIANDLSGDSHTIGAAQELIIDQPIVNTIDKASWDEFAVVPLTSVGTEAYGMPNSKPELMSTSKMADRLDWADYSALSSQNSTAGPIEKTFYYSSSEHYTACRLNPTSLNIATNTGKPAAFAYFTNAASFDSAQYVSRP